MCVKTIQNNAVFTDITKLESRVNFIQYHISKKDEQFSKESEKYSAYFGDFHLLVFVSSNVFWLAHD